MSKMKKQTNKAIIKVTLDFAPNDEGEFDEWCRKYDFTPLNSGRRAWCNQFETYFRDADGVATTPSGETFLFYKEDRQAILADLLALPELSEDDATEVGNYIGLTYRDMGRNELRKSIRQALTDYFGGEEK